MGIMEMLNRKKGPSPDVISNPSNPEDDIRLLGGSILLTKLDAITGWARKYSFFQYPFVTACCGMEFMSVAGRNMTWIDSVPHSRDFPQTGRPSDGGGNHQP